MFKRLTIFIVLVVIVLSCVFAEDPWYYNQKISNFSISGLKNVSESDINNVLYDYRNKPFTDESYNEMVERLYDVDGIDFFTAEAEKVEAGTENEEGSVIIAFEFYELPKIGRIVYVGNEKIKTINIRDTVTGITTGMFLDPSRKGPFETAKTEIQALYSSKGFQDVPIEYEIALNEETNILDVTFDITEGDQSRVTEIRFTGNDHFDASTLKKQLSSKVKSLFNAGYLDMAKLRDDADAIAAFYQTNGYIDVIVSSPIVEYVDSSNTKYKEATVTYNIEEGNQWFYGGLEVNGNTIFTDEQIDAVKSMKVGSVLDLSAVANEYDAIANLYFDNGYIYTGVNTREERDDTTMTAKYILDITEGPQATVEDILFTGLEKTKDYVMRRELEIHPGDVFSRAKLITSGQNLYNTGLISSLDYDILRSNQEENKVVLQFKLEEGNTKDIQFGATFGGTVDSFPISAFVQWNDHNLGGRGQELGISLTASPDTQSLNVSFGDDWFKNYRWSNSVSFGFSHSSHTNELQRGVDSPYYDGRNDDEAYPLGYDSASQWQASNGAYPQDNRLMKYNLLTFSLGYNTGYTFIYDVGRLSLYGGLNFSLNRALYADKYDPYERLIRLYSLGWKFSNKLNIGIQWDGRDYITNPTKGYVLSASFTYAGGLLQGLSNYNKLSVNAAGYLRLFSFQTKSEKTKNIMLCVSTSVNLMLPQLYNYTTAYGADDKYSGVKFWDPKLGATKYEMLYIDGMTIGRGFNAVVDQAFLWDNMLEVSYQLVENVLQAEVFVSATGVNKALEDIKSGINWYFAAGAGIKLKISGFPLGLYLVKNATFRTQTEGATSRTFQWEGGNYFHGKNPGSGMSLVLAISTSLI